MLLDDSYGLGLGLTAVILLLTFVGLLPISLNLLPYVRHLVLPGNVPEGACLGLQFFIIVLDE